MMAARITTPCLVCGGPHYSKGLCSKHYQQQYRKSNKQRITLLAKQWKENNRSKVNALNAKWANANKDKVAMKNAKLYERKHEHYAKNSALWYAANKDKRAIQTSLWHKNNKDKHNAVNAAWWREHKGQQRAKHAKYSASKLSATPKWANKFFIDEIYDLANRRTMSTGIKWHVDHIVPLRSKRVCGLHCEKNLQVISAVQNGIKSNRVWPDMPT